MCGHVCRGQKVTGWLDLGGRNNMIGKQSINSFKMTHFCNNSPHTVSLSPWDCRQACLSGCHLPCPRPDSLQISVTFSSPSLWRAWELTHLMNTGTSYHCFFWILRFLIRKGNKQNTYSSLLLLYSLTLATFSVVSGTALPTCVHIMAARVPVWMCYTCFNVGPDWEVGRAVHIQDLWTPSAPLSHFLTLTMEQGLEVKEWK